MTKELVLIGGGGHCRSCIDVIELAGGHKIVGIVDIPEKSGQKVFNYLIQYTDGDIPRLVQRGVEFLITIGQIKTPTPRLKYFEMISQMGGQFATIISPLAHVSSHSSVGEGTIVLHHALINSNVKVGKNCIINSKSLLEHDVEVGDHCHISTGAILNGKTLVGDKVFFGSGSVSRETIQIPDGALIPMGENVNRDYRYD